LWIYIQTTPRKNVVAAVNNRWLRSDHRLPARAFIERMAAELEGAAVVVHLDSGAEAILEFGSGRKYRAQPLRPFRSFPRACGEPPVNWRFFEATKSSQKLVLLSDLKQHLAKQEKSEVDHRSPVDTFSAL
jgi:hypothetical protein